MAKKRWLEVGVKTDFSKFKKHMSQAAISVAKFGAAAAAGAAVAVTALTRASMQSIDKLGKLSDELDISTEALRTYQQAAKLSGISNDDLQRGLQRLARSMGEAKLGIGEGVRGLSLLGITADQIKNKSIDQTFEMIADAIQKQPDAATRAAAAYNLFGRSGQSMMNLLMGGSEGLNLMRKELEALGVIVSRDAAAGVEQANDALANLGLVTEGVGNQLAIKFSPLIAQLAEETFAWSVETQNSTKTVDKSFEKTSDTVKFLADAFQLADYYWHIFTGSINAAIGGVEWAFNWLVKQGKILGVNIYSWSISMSDFGARAAISFANAIDALEPFVSLIQEAYNTWAKLAGAGEIRITGAGGITDQMRSGAREQLAGNRGRRADVRRDLNQLYESEVESYFLDTAGAEFKKADAAWKKYVSGEPQKKVDEFFEKVANRTTAKKPGAADPDPDDMAAEFEKIQRNAATSASPISQRGTFAQIQSRFMDVRASVGRPQQVTDPQLKKTNSILESIRKQGGTAQAVTV